MSACQGRLKLLATVLTTTRIMSGDVTADVFAFLCNGDNRWEYLKLHLHPLPGSTSTLPPDGIVLHLKGFGKDVSTY
jgi:hypothetical protein